MRWQCYSRWAGGRASRCSFDILQLWSFSGYREVAIVQIILQLFFLNSLSSRPKLLIFLVQCVVVFLANLFVVWACFSLKRLLFLFLLVEFLLQPLGLLVHGDDLGLEQFKVLLDAAFLGQTSLLALLAEGKHLLRLRCALAMLLVSWGLLQRFKFPYECILLLHLHFVLFRAAIDSFLSLVLLKLWRGAALLVLAPIVLVLLHGRWAFVEGAVLDSVD